MMIWIGRLSLVGLCLSFCLPFAADASSRLPLPPLACDSQERRVCNPDPGANKPLLQATQPDQEFLIAQGDGDLFHPSVASGGIIVWYARGSGGMDVFGLHLGHDGYTPGKPFVIAGGPGDQSLPFVANDTQHSDYLVVWHDQRGRDADIYARYLDADGNPVGDPFAISAAPGDQLRPSAAYVRAADAFLVVWQDSRTDAVGPDVYARLVPSLSTAASGGGSRSLGKEFVVSASRGGQYIPTTACETARAQCLVVWQDDRSMGVLFTDVMGRMVDAGGGVAMGGEIDVAVATDYQYSPVVAFNPVSSEYLVVWDDDISARRLSLAGLPIGGKIRISLESPHQYKPAVAVAEDGTYLIVWEDLRNLSTRGADIYGQWLSSAGRPSGSNFALTKDPSNQYSPTLVAGQGWGPAGFLVLWEDDRTTGKTLSLYGEWLSHSSGGE